MQIVCPECGGRPKGMQDMIGYYKCQRCQDTGAIEVVPCTDVTAAPDSADATSPNDMWRRLNQGRCPCCGRPF